MLYLFQQRCDSTGVRESIAKVARRAPDTISAARAEAA
eukprot:gene3304-biopygen420